MHRRGQPDFRQTSKGSTFPMTGGILQPQALRLYLRRGRGSRSRNSSPTATLTLPAMIRVSVHAERRSKRDRTAARSREESLRCAEPYRVLDFSLLPDASTDIIFKI